MLACSTILDELDCNRFFLSSILVFVCKMPIWTRATVLQNLLSFSSMIWVSAKFSFFCKLWLEIITELWGWAPNWLVLGQPLPRDLYLMMTCPRLLIPMMNGLLSGQESGIGGFFQVKKIMPFSNNPVIHARIYVKSVYIS